MASNAKRRLAVIGVATLIIAPWPALAAAWLLLEPTLVQWTMMVTAAAVASEAGLWVGAVVLGVSAFKRIRERLRLKRDAKPQSED